MTGKQVFLIIATMGLLAGQVASAQQVTIKGVIVDQTNNEPIHGATVRTDNSRGAGLTNAKGQFALSVPSRPDTLMVKAAGYAPEKVALPSDTQMLKGLRIGLRTSNWQSLQEVVISGYQIPTTPKASTGNAGVIREQTIEEESQTTISPALDQEPGLHYQQGTYSTGRITVRGVGSRSP